MDIKPYEFKTEPFKHQLEEWTCSRNIPARAIFWEQGTGKSKLIIDTAAWLWKCGLIDGVVIVAPNGVHRNWVETEIPDHLPDEVMDVSAVFHYQSERADTKWHAKAVSTVTAHKGLAWLAISYEAFMTKKGKKAMIDFFDRRRLLYVLDEGHYIKNMQATRTKSILKSAKYAPFKRILTGTPIADGPFDAYSEIKFLEADFWDKHDLSTLAEYRTHFGVFGQIFNPNLKKQFNVKTQKWEACDGGYVKILKNYRRLDELNQMLSPIASRVTKDDVLDLPPKLFQKRYVKMSDEQRRHYAEMRDTAMTWIATGAEPETEEDVKKAAEVANQTAECATCHGQMEIKLEGFIYKCPDCDEDHAPDTEGRTAVFGELAITRLLRLQQITCGYLPSEDPEEPMYMIPGVNHRLEALMDILENSGHKIIVWSRFTLDIDLIMKECADRGIAAVRYDGKVNDDGRAESKARFQGVRPVYENKVMVGREDVPEEEQAKVFVGNPAAGATGLTLTKAKTVIYYSNSFKLIDRLQSEDRAHRIGQDNQVLYIDIMAENTMDEKTVEALRNKFNIARQITGDQLKEWI